MPSSHDPARHLHSHAQPGVEGGGRDLPALSPARQRILDVLLAAHRPLGAYDIINHLAQLTGRSPAPISVYRALDHLVEQGMVHRLASRNAYLACGHGHDGAERVAFLICDACGVVSEVSSGDLARSLGALARGHDFETRQSVIELAGRCGACAHSASQDE